MLDLNFENKLSPQKGYLLVAEPFMSEDYFKRSVVLLCEHNQDGSFGFVLNNFIDISAEEILQEEFHISTKICVGGPVNLENFYYLHSFGEEIPGSIPISPNCFLGGDFNVLIEHIKKKDNPDQFVRFFVGYSGWDKGQLEKEIQEKSWIVVQPANDNIILEANRENLWQNCLQKLGGKYKSFAQIPINPHNN